MRLGLLRRLPRTMLQAGLGLILAAGWLAYQGSAHATSGAPLHPRVVFRIAVPRIAESSSLVHSVVHPGLFYTANDSGDGPYVYVLDSSGRLVGTTTLQGVDPVDVEAMAGGSDGSLIVGDIGDNLATRTDVQIYRIVQPSAGDATVPAEKVTLTYTDGPHDAESMIYDAEAGRVFVITKEPFGMVYESPRDVFTLTAATLRPIASAPTIATDATFLPGQRAVIVRTYEHAYVYGYPSWRLVTSFGLPRQKQGESITTVGTKAVWVGSEGVDSPVWAVPLPPAVARLGGGGTPSGGGSPTPTAPAGTAPSFSAPSGPSSAGGTGEGAGAGDSTAKAIVTFSGSAGVLVVVVGTVVVLSRRRTTRRLNAGPKPPTDRPPTTPPP